MLLQSKIEIWRMNMTLDKHKEHFRTFNNRGSTPFDPLS